MSDPRYSLFSKAKEPRKSEGTRGAGYSRGSPGHAKLNCAARPLLTVAMQGLAEYWTAWPKHLCGSSLGYLKSVHSFCIFWSGCTLVTPRDVYVQLMEEIEAAKKTLEGAKSKLAAAQCRKQTFRANARSLASDLLHAQEATRAAREQNESWIRQLV